MKRNKKIYLECYKQLTHIQRFPTPRKSTNWPKSKPDYVQISLNCSKLSIYSCNKHCISTNPKTTDLSLMWLCTWEEEAGGSGVQSKPELESESEAGSGFVSYKRPCLKNTKTELENDPVAKVAHNLL